MYTYVHVKVLIYSTYLHCIVLYMAKKREREERLTNEVIYGLT